MKTSQPVFAVTANFTAEPLADVLRFWTERLGLGPVRVAFSGYNQVFQVLLDGEHLMASSEPGVNLVLIRLEDWAGDQDRASCTKIVRTAVHEFIGAMTSFAKAGKRPVILMLCPASKKILEDVEFACLIQALEAEISSALTPCQVTVVNSAEVAALYPVEVADDAESDRHGHIPFSPAYWVAIGTMLARKARTFLQPPHKVLALDADNTLWGGVAAEMGATRVQVTGIWRQIQEYLLSRKNQGMLLALVSKNREEDVAEVFSRPEMTLRREDFSGWKVNWKSKSENLRALASELELGLDSFIFLDDNQMECAEVAAHCPTVTVLPLPMAETAVTFLRHVWALDLPLATSLDTQRTEQYKEQAERKRLQAGVNSFAEFFARLDLHVELSAPRPNQIERAAQLTQRTNQFNTSGLRRTAPELASLLRSGDRQALVARVRDRFGDYGEVGLCVYSLSDQVLEAENFLLSCRVLGKGVEHQLLAALGRIAVELRRPYVVIPFRGTERNEPAARFLDAVGGAYRQGNRYCFPAAEAMSVVFNPGVILERSAQTFLEPDVKGSSVGVLCDFAKIAAKLATVPEIQSAVRQTYSRSRPLATDFVAPRNSIEQKLADIWADVLGLDRVGIDDNFFDLGGDSVRTIQVLSRAKQAGLGLTLTEHFKCPRIADLALCVRAEGETTPKLEPTGMPSTTLITPSPRFSLARMGHKRLDELIGHWAKNV